MPGNTGGYASLLPEAKREKERKIESHTRAEQKKQLSHRTCGGTTQIYNTLESKQRQCQAEEKRQKKKKRASQAQIGVMQGKVSMLAAQEEEESHQAKT